MHPGLWRDRRGYRLHQSLESKDGFKDKYLRTDLYLKTGFSRAKISVYMKNLAASDIIEKTGNIDIIAQNEVREKSVRIIKTETEKHFSGEIFDNNGETKCSAGVCKDSWREREK